MWLRSFSASNVTTSFLCLKNNTSIKFASIIYTTLLHSLSSPTTCLNHSIHLWCHQESLILIWSTSHSVKYSWNTILSHIMDAFFPYFVLKIWSASCRKNIIISVTSLQTVEDAVNDNWCPLMPIINIRCNLYDVTFCLIMWSSG